MDKRIEEALAIRYVKLHFTIRFVEDCIMPINKASALRGGMGEMLLRANCIRNRDCDSCDFFSECIVQRTMYSKFENKPDFITTGDSVGYVIECEDYREYMNEGDTLSFRLLLFGKTIVYFNQYIQAFFALGQNGVGKNSARFTIESVTNTKNHAILNGYDVHMKYYQVSTVYDYVKYRLSMLESDLYTITIKVKTPLTIKYQGEFLQEFNMDAFVRAIKRRIYMLDCFENIDGNALYSFQECIPKITYQEHEFVAVNRYSTRQNQHMSLKGIKGRVDIGDVNEDVLALLFAGELIHIGKNTSFGFGRYHLGEIES